MQHKLVIFAKISYTFFVFIPKTQTVSEQILTIYTKDINKIVCLCLQKIQMKLVMYKTQKYLRLSKSLFLNEKDYYIDLIFINIRQL